MPPKSSQRSRSQKKSTKIPDDSSLTKESFEKELQGLAAKAKEQTTFNFARQQLSIIVSAAGILVLAAIYSNVSQLILAPVYGSIPSSIWHSTGITAACFLGWSGAFFLDDMLPVAPIKLLPVIAIYVPAIQSFLFHFSSTFGPEYGPIITEIFTFLPLLLLSSSSAALILDNLDTSFLDKRIADAAPGVASFAFYRGMEIVFGGLIRQSIGTYVFLSRLSLQAVLSALYCRVSLSPLLFLTIPAILHTATFNPHVPLPWTTTHLNSTLAQDGWTLLARQDSLTGYISVLENTKQQFRVLRCDHSLLGGEWLQLPQGLLPGTSEVKEPIYAVFAMLEAVRLVELPDKIVDKDANALVIGLGIGTTPSAFIAHGINTTVLEIDPVVVSYAETYFDMPPAHTVVTDATTYVSSLVSDFQNLDADQLNAGVGVTKYDYIVHDVFSGGAEPVELFTQEFLKDLFALLKPGGVIAINYAGDLSLPSTRLTISTIKSVFPSCRLYREIPPSASSSPSDSSSSSGSSKDFNNLVFFCRRTAAPIQFRAPTESDFLGSASRRQHLLPKPELEVDVEAEGMRVRDEDWDGDEKVLKRGDISNGKVVQWRREDALGHWGIMRRVVPAKVWELW